MPIADRPMKIAILDTYYPAFLRDWYAQHQTLADRRYEEQHRGLLDACFGTSDFYSHYLADLGCEGVDLIANAIPLQAAWARENGCRMSSLALRIDYRLTRVPLLGNFLAQVPGLIRLVMEQIRRIKPDVLYCQDMSFLPPPVMRALRKHVRLVVGQIASPAPSREYLECFDLILTSFPHFVPKFRAMGIASEYFRIGFDPRILDRVATVERDLDATFVGGITSAHARGTQLLEDLARSTPLVFFGYGVERLSGGSPISKRHRGEVWGLEMYRTLARSRATINRHIDVAENFANNMRLYEATGMGALLVTDKKDNLGELFDVGREIVAYESADHAAELIRYYVENPSEAAAIAHAGQMRTLRDHTYLQRMQELVPLLGAALGRTRRA